MTIPDFVNVAGRTQDVEYHCRLSLARNAEPTQEMLQRRLRRIGVAVPNYPLRT